MRTAAMGITVLVVAGLLIQACTDHSDTPRSDTPLMEPGFRSIGGPEHPGSSGVFRFGTAFGIRLDYDTDGGVRLVRHYPADDSFEVCGGSQVFPIAEEQYVTDPNLVNGVIVLLQKARDIPVLIYPPADGSKQLCDYLRDDWLFKGTRRLLYHDNNFFFDPSRTNSFGWSGQGSMQDRNGNTYRYSENRLIVVDPETFTEHVVRAELKITPGH